MKEFLQKHFTQEGRRDSRTLRKPLSITTLDINFPTFRIWANLLLQNNSSLVQDIEKQYANHSDKIVAAIIPRAGVIVAMMDNEVKVVQMTLSCTQNAAKKIVGQKHYTKHQGYKTVLIENTVATELIDFLDNQEDPEHPSETFNFGQHLYGAHKYISLDLQGFLKGTYSSLPSRRTSFPLDTGKVVFDK